jgi:hypothetical protein
MLGRRAFLRRYERSRSSKYFLLFEGRFFDTKPLVAAAHRHAVGRRVANLRFGGGLQTKRVLERLLTLNSRGSDWELIKDAFRELANFPDDFDRPLTGRLTIENAGFSDWIPFSKLASARTMTLPGVYVIACSRRRPKQMSAASERIVYVGETTSQSLRTRLRQFKHSVDTGRRAHSGGRKLHSLGINSSELFAAIRSFPLDYQVAFQHPQLVRSTQIKFLERLLLNEYALTHGKLPAGNSM